LGVLKHVLLLAEAFMSIDVWAPTNACEGVLLLASIICKDGLTMSQHTSKLRTLMYHRNIYQIVSVINLETTMPIYVDLELH
jgi:hypothetical protein